MSARYSRCPLMEPLEHRLLLAATVGSLDLVTTWPNGMPLQVAGWAFDADLGPNGTNPVQVRLDIDGFPSASQLAVTPRADIVPVVGSAEHGYVFTVLPLAPGNHTLRVVATDLPFGTEVVLGTRALNVQPGALGVIDSFDVSRGISGWAFDPVLSSAAVNIRVDVDGTPVSTTSTTVTRPDLLQFFGSVNHGFNVPVPVLSGGTHQVSVYALSLMGHPTLLGTFATAAPGPPFGSLDAANGSIIGGWAVDPDDTSASLQIRIDIDGLPFRTVNTSIRRPDLAQFGPGTYGFQIATPTLAPGQHTVQMYAVDIPSGNAVLIGQRTFIADQRPPIGSLDLLTANGPGVQAAGWAIDPDAPTHAVQIRIDVDGVPVSTTTASLERPDLGVLFGTTAHGYNVALAPMAPGSRRVDVFALDLQNGFPTLLGSRTLVIT